MPLKLIALSAFVLAVSMSSTSPTALAQTAEQAPDPVVATVNGEKIYRSQLIEHMKALPEQIRNAPIEAIYMPLIERMVQMKIVANAARSEGMEKDEIVQRRLDYYEDRMVMDQFFADRIESEVTDEKIRRVYDEEVSSADAREELHARHILVESKELAEALIGELGGGADFAELAQKHSTGPSGPRGGDLGYFTADMMVPAFSKAAGSLNVGEVSPRPVQTEFGWHVIKVEDKRAADPPSFEEMRGEIQAQLAESVYRSVIEELSATAKVEVFGPDGKALPDESAAEQ